jgi:hypothetical protein
MGVVYGFAKRADPAVDDSLDDSPEIHVHADNAQNGALAVVAEVPIQPLGLVDCAGKAIEDKTGCGIGKAKPVGNHAVHDLVGHKAAELHDSICLDAQRGSVCDIRAEYFSGRYGWNAPEFGKLLRLGSFAYTWRAEQQDGSRFANCEVI